MKKKWKQKLSQRYRGASWPQVECSWKELGLIHTLVPGFLLVRILHLIVLSLGRQVTFVPRVVLLLVYRFIAAKKNTEIEIEPKVSTQSRRFAFHERINISVAMPRARSHKVVFLHEPHIYYAYIS